MCNVSTGEGYGNHAPYMTSPKVDRPNGLCSQVRLPRLLSLAKNKTYGRPGDGRQCSRVAELGEREREEESWGGIRILAGTGGPAQSLDGPSMSRQKKEEKEAIVPRETLETGVVITKQRALRFLLKIVPYWCTPMEYLFTTTDRQTMGSQARRRLL
ncbi:hypothetical protein LX36DRAFT_471949 [Colletotrichum falcatum]|nr:hypothetical protein LX36DRAFT_471949 [Colletotrichum falcatum]